MNCVLLPNNTSSQEYHHRLTHPALGQTSGFTNSMYEDVPLSTSMESDPPPPPPARPPPPPPPHFNLLGSTWCCYYVSCT